MRLPFTTDQFFDVFRRYKPFGLFSGCRCCLHCWQPCWRYEAREMRELAIAKGIVEAHGGRIWIESSPGEGTTASFSLPFA